MLLIGGVEYEMIYSIAKKGSNWDRKNRKFCRFFLVQIISEASGYNYIGVQLLIF